MKITESITKEVDLQSKLGIFYDLLESDKLAIELGLYDLEEGLCREFLKYVSIQDIVQEKIRDL